MFKPKASKVVYGLILCVCGVLITSLAIADPDELLHSLNMKEARVYRLEGDVQVQRSGKRWQEVKKDMRLAENDRLGIGRESFIELSFENRKDVILKCFGRSDFLLKDLSRLTPYGFEVRFEPEIRATQIVLHFKEESFYKKYAQDLISLGMHYTFVNVFQGLVNVDGVLSDESILGSSLLAKGFATYVFEGMAPFPPLATKEALEVCLEECEEEERRK